MPDNELPPYLADSGGKITSPCVPSFPFMMTSSDVPVLAKADKRKEDIKAFTFSLYYYTYIFNAIRI